MLTARERWRQDGTSVTPTEYPMAGVGGERKVVDRRTRERLHERDVSECYGSWFDEPPASADR